MWLVVSDSHDNMLMLKKISDLISKKNITHIFHCGDFVAPFTLPLLIRDGVEFFGVFGNNDGERLLLREKSRNRIFPSPHELEVAGKRIAMFHEPYLLESVAQSGVYDFVFYGHTHEVDIRRVGNTLIVNPGESCGYLTGKATVVLLDPKTGSTELLEIR